MERTETERRFARLARWLKAVDTLTPAETAARDRLVAALTGMRVAEVVPQCEGSEDEHGRPACHGTDVRKVVFRLADGTVYGANWCAECRALARNMGDDRVILSIDTEALPPLPTDYPCRNSADGCKRRVTRQYESCSPACGWASINECREGCR